GSDASCVRKPAWWMGRTGGRERWKRCPGQREASATTRGVAPAGLGHDPKPRSIPRASRSPWCAQQYQAAVTGCGRWCMTALQAVGRIRYRGIAMLGQEASGSVPPRLNLQALPGIRDSTLPEWELPMRLPVPYRIAFVASLMCLSALAAAATPAVAPARVMLIGMFHFANPGRDMVKNRVIDVTAPANQSYLEGLAARLAAFEPTDVLVECSPADQDRYDQRFRDYLAGRFELPVNETYQIGFRVARHAR